MAGGDRAVVRLNLRLPPELIMVSKLYQSDRRIVSLNAAIIELLETHPAIVQMVTDLYAVTSL